MPSKNKKPFRSVKTEIKEIGHKPKGRNLRAYELAFLDEDFMMRRALRSVRLQLELLKPELALQEENIESTVVIFGSARIPELKVAKRQLKLAKADLKKTPKNTTRHADVKIAENVVKNSFYYEEARKLSSIISKNCQKGEKREFVVTTGGGPGIMEAANRGAKDVHAKSIGLNILLPHEQAPNSYISPEFCFQFHYFAIRKMHFLIRARAAVFFPGGLGTLDELFETLTLIQTKKTRPFPILLFGKAYWNRIINFDALIEEGMISREDLLLFQYAETAEEAWKFIADFYHLPQG